MGKMIRFEPDTGVDALMRPFAMAAPDAGVYVEIQAPDVRFAVMVLLAVAALLAWRRLGSNRKPVLALLALTALSMWPWLETSGNGRYYIPMLLAVGPLCVGLICLLPVTRSFRLFLALLVLALQMFVVLQNPPWGAWEWLAWKDAPYFQVDAPPDEGGRPVTYVTISSVSYSLIAPRFPASSRWINFSSRAATPKDAAWAQQFLAEADSLTLMVPSIRQQMTADRQPTEEVKKLFDTLLAGQRLALQPEKKCEFLPSKGLVGIAIRNGLRDDAIDMEQFGFWLCPLRYPVDRPAAAKSPSFLKAEAVFERVEALCPRFFPPGNGGTQVIPGGALRQYSESDTKLYVL
ncbi:MAG: hypothetical protein O9327_17995, partial [Polaromonas sp.]|nr:hypothetical protein [Polaromonas sp.]